MGKDYRLLFTWDGAFPSRRLGEMRDSLKERTLQDRRSHCKMLSDRTSKTIMRSHYGRAEIAGVGWVSGSVTHAVSKVVARWVSLPQPRVLTLGVFR